MKQRWSFLLGAGVLLAACHASLAADAPAPAANPAQAKPAAASPQGTNGRSASNLSEEQRKCASRMYNARTRGRSAPDWTAYDRCMRQRGAP